MVDISVLQRLVWTDYRLAVLFTVLMPLILLVWAFVKHQEVIQQLLVIYWKVASLLAITLYLMIAGLAVSFVSAFMACFLIPLSLWFWADLNEEIREQPPSALKLALSSWRWAVTFYSGLGVLLQIPFLRCGFSRQALAEASCQVWLEAPRLFKSYFHADQTPGFLGFFGVLGLVIYMLYLGYFVFFRVGRQGRSALNQ
jgi:hypothetical protein